MKWFIIILSALAGIGLYVWWKSRPQAPQRMLTRAQKNAGNNSVLATYSTLMPIAQLARVPWTNNNARMVDPYFQVPVGPTVISQNGNN